MVFSVTHNHSDTHSQHVSEQVAITMEHKDPDVATLHKTD